LPYIEGVSAVYLISFYKKNGKCPVVDYALEKDPKHAGKIKYYFEMLE